MSSLKAKTVDFNETQTLYASPLDRKTEDQGGLLSLYIINRILIHVPVARDRDTSSELTENEEITERWKEEVDSALVFVCAGPTILCIFPSKAYVQGWFIFGFLRSLPC